MSTVEIPLNHGKVAIIDESDLPLVQGIKWHVITSGRNRTLYARGYVRGSRCNLAVRMHRRILGVEDPNILVDHRDGDGLNNRRKNIRVATHSQNAWNKRKTHGRSQFKGVFKDWNRFRVQICVDRSVIRVGSFLNEEEAARAYDEAAIRYFGEFANLNFPAFVST